MELFLKNRISRLQIFDTSTLQLPLCIKNGILEALVLNSFRPSVLSGSSRGYQTDYRATLLVDGSPIDVTSDRYLDEGEYLHIRTSTDGTLVAFNARARQSADLNSPLTLIHQGLRKFLPLQQSFFHLYLILKVISELPAHVRISPDIKSGAQNIIQNIPTLEKAINNESFKELILNSGSFLESKLAYASQQVAPHTKQKAADFFVFDKDFKVELLKLINILQRNGFDTSASPPLKKAPRINDPLIYTSSLQSLYVKPKAQQKSKTEPLANLLLTKLSKLLIATLAKIQVNQLVSLEHQCQSCGETDAPVNSWVLDLPILHEGKVEVINIQIEQHPKDNECGKLCFLWTTRLNFDFNEQGHMLFELQLLEGTVSANIWAESESTHKEVLNFKDGLAEQFRKTGANIGDIHCHLGLSENNSPSLSHRLVDIHS